MRLYAISVAVLFILPMFILCYVTLVAGDTFTDKQWGVALGLMFAGMFLETPFLVWLMEQDYKKRR